MKTEVIVVGAGASGLVSAIEAARCGSSVTVLEHTSKAGKKLLATGNGKCNLTNLAMPEGALRGGKPEFIKEVLSKVSVGDAMNFFRDLGLVLTDRNGYVYPNTGQAASVAEALLFELERLKVPILYDCNVSGIGKNLVLQTSCGEMKAEAVILAAGSMAAPKTGSDGSGYGLAEALGHHIIKPLPALVQLRCKEKWYKQAAGVRTEALVTLKVNGKKTASDRGELQFTDYGISGIPVFQISRFAARAVEERKTVTAELDFFPDMDFETMEDFLFCRKNKFSSRPGTEFLHGVLNQKLAHVLLKISGIARERTGEITAPEVKRLCAFIKGLKTTVISANSFDQAQICSGGIDLRDVNSLTMESKLVKGLYLAGEILDVDGICGGYNLQWAWSSGILAGRNAGREKK